MKIKPLTMTPHQLINMVPGTIEEYVAQQRRLKEHRREQEAMILGDGTPDEDQPEGILTNSERLRREGLEICDLVRKHTVFDRLLLASEAVKAEQADMDAMFPPNTSGDGAGWCPDYQVSDEQGWL